MATNPNNLPVNQFLVIPMLDAVQLDFQKAVPSGTLDSAKAEASRMLASNEDGKVVIFQAVNMLALTKKIDVIWSPKTAG